MCGVLELIPNQAVFHRAKDGVLLPNCANGFPQMKPLYGFELLSTELDHSFDLVSSLEMTLATNARRALR